MFHRNSSQLISRNFSPFQSVIMSTTHLFVAFNFLLFFCAANGDLPRYSRCIASQDVKGMCVSLDECKIVKEQVRTNTIRSNPPKVCSQIDKTLCCPVTGLENISRATQPTVTEVNTHFYEGPADATYRETKRYPSNSTIETIKKSEKLFRWDLVVKFHVLLFCQFQFLYFFFQKNRMQRIRWCSNGHKLRIITIALRESKRS